MHADKETTLMYLKTLGIVGATLALTLTVTASAFARAGDRPFAQTYPVASALCDRAHAGTLGSKLEPQAVAVVNDCNALKNPYGMLVSTVDAAEAAYLNVVSTQKGLVTTACPEPVTDQTACSDARATAKSTIAAARMTEQTAVTSYQTSIEANRTTFWNAISALR
jgi:hypothetical protein